MMTSYDSEDEYIMVKNPTTPPGIPRNLSINSDDTEGTIIQKYLERNLPQAPRKQTHRQNG